MRKFLTTAFCTTLAATAVGAMFPQSAIANGAIAGTVSFEGDSPTRRPMQMAADPVCEKANPDGRLGEVMVINNGKIANVFVYIKDGLGDVKPAVPTDPVVIDQSGCMYTPHVVGARVGQVVQIMNSDPTLHNVHSLAKESRQFNSAMPIKGMKIKKKFTAPEIMVKMKCDVHPWMGAYIGVLDHPYFGVTGEDGSFSITDVPAGKYTVEAWHEHLGTKTGTATVAADGTASVNFSFAPAAP